MVSVLISPITLNRYSLLVSCRTGAQCKFKVSERHLQTHETLDALRHQKTSTAMLAERIDGLM